MFHAPFDRQSFETAPGLRPSLPLDGLIAEASRALPAPRSLDLIDEITHRMVNEYTEAICGLALAAASIPNLQAQTALTQAATRLRAQVEAHRALQSPFADGPIDLADYVAALCAQLAQALLADTGVRLTVDADEVWLDAERGWRVGLIIAELVRNAARHGLRDRPGDIRVEIADIAGRIHCRVFDDGEGVTVARVGRGRRIVQALAADLGGTMHWSFSPSGCAVCLTFPVAPVALVDPAAVIDRRVRHVSNVQDRS
jgi:two-component sensor histidine kinase